MRRRYCASGLVAPPGTELRASRVSKITVPPPFMKASRRRIAVPRLRPACDDRPVEQRIEGELVPVRVDADRIARLERRAVGEDLRQAGQARLAGRVDLRRRR